MENIQIDINKKIKRDLEYIKNDLIAKQSNKNKSDDEDEIELYVKFSRIINSIAVINMTKKQYKKYWTTQYQKFPEKLGIILAAIKEKFSNGLMTSEEMIKIIENGKDRESEKKSAIKVLKRKE